MICLAVYLAFIDVPYRVNLSNGKQYDDSKEYGLEYYLQNLQAENILKLKIYFKHNDLPISSKNFCWT